MCYVESVTHREMRNQSGEVLRRVAAGESVQVTNHGQVAAIIVPPGRTELAMLTELGQVREALRGPETLRAVRRRRPTRTSAQIVAESRGRW